MMVESQELLESNKVSAEIHQILEEVGLGELCVKQPDTKLCELKTRISAEILDFLLRMWVEYGTVEFMYRFIFDHNYYLKHKTWQLEPSVLCKVNGLLHLKTGDNIANTIKPMLNDICETWEHNNFYLYFKAEQKHSSLKSLRRLSTYKFFRLLCNRLKLNQPTVTYTFSMINEC